MTGSARCAVGVCIGVELRRLMTGAGWVMGLAGNVENGPSATLRLLGGLPRSLPEAEPLFSGQAEDTVELRYRLRDLEDVIAD